MDAKSLLRRLACAFLAVVVAGSFLAAPGYSVSAKSPSAAFTDCVSQAQIPAAECEALVALYHSANGPGWSDHTGWLETDTPCSWFGVTCSGGTSVTQLILEANQLSGFIPPQLGNLSNLEWLGLNSNQLRGRIPAELGNLTQLTNLDLSANRLSGPIPPQLGGLPILVSLWLNQNRLSGHIPAALGNLTHLQLLQLSANRLSGPIPPQLGSLGDLHYLVLDHNRLAGSLPAELGNLTGLLQLHLDHNRLTGEIPVTILNLTNLTDLTLSCGLTSSDPAVIAFLDALVPGWQDDLCVHPNH